MAGRGRGRGRGASSSFSREQLNSMGFSANEALPSVVTQPPPLYPPLERKPVPLTSTLEINYMLILKQDLIENLRYSSACVERLIEKPKEPEQEIDKLLAQLPKLQQNCQFDWNLLPKELRSKIIPKRKNQSSKQVDVENRLKALEKIEEKKDTGKAIKQEVPEAEEDEMIEEEVDEEMDDGTDYANNYFDNGEDYEEEDDNLDDGPIY